MVTSGVEHAGGSCVAVRTPLLHNITRRRRMLGAFGVGVGTDVTVCAGTLLGVASGRALGELAFDKDLRGLGGVRGRRLTLRFSDSQASNAACATCGGGVGGGLGVIWKAAALGRGGSGISRARIRRRPGGGRRTPWADKDFGVGCKFVAVCSELIGAASVLETWVLAFATRQNCSATDSLALRLGIPGPAGRYAGGMAMTPGSTPHGLRTECESELLHHSFACKDLLLLFVFKGFVKTPDPPAMNM